MELDMRGLQRASDLRAAGYSEKEVRRMLSDGALSRVRRGTYLVGAPPDKAAARHTLQVRATLEDLADGAVASHVSAVVLHGLPVWGVDLTRVHATRAKRTGGRTRARVHVHTASLSPDKITLADGLPLTTMARSVVDVARSVPFEQAVVVADAALRSRRVDRSGLDDALARAARWPGCPMARRAIAFADGRSASPGESRSRVAILRAGLPTPVLQWEVQTCDGQQVRQVDFAWPELRTVGEFDGQVKYGRLLRPGESPGDAVFREKVREDELRAEDLGVARWIWLDLTRFTPVAERIRARFRPA